MGSGFLQILRPRVSIEDLTPPNDRTGNAFLVGACTAGSDMLLALAAMGRVEVVTAETMGRSKTRQHNGVWRLYAHWLVQPDWHDCRFDGPAASRSSNGSSSFLTARTARGRLNSTRPQCTWQSCVGCRPPGLPGYEETARAGRAYLHVTAGQLVRLALRLKGAYRTGDAVEVASRHGGCIEACILVTTDGRHLWYFQVFIGRCLFGPP